MAKGSKEALLSKLYFFVFGATIVGETIITALIVSSLGAQVLSKLYLVNGLILFILPLILYSRIDRSNRGDQLKQVSIIALFVVIGLYILYVGLYRNNPSIASSVLLVFYPFSYLLKSVMFLTFWTVANDISDTAESKKIFPEVAAFGFLGGLIGALISRAFLEYFPAEGIVLFWGILYGFAYLYAGFVSKKYHSLLMPKETLEKKNSRPPILEAAKSIYRSPLLTSLSKFYYLTYIIIFMLDYYFWSQCGLRYDEPSLLTKFSYNFYILYSLITFGFLRQVTPRLIAEKGITTVFTYLPISLIIGGGLYVANFIIPSVSADVLFYFLIFWQIIRIVSFENFFSPVYQMFFTSIDKNHRGRAKMAIEGVVKPTAIISSGLLLWLTESTPWLQVILALVTSVLLWKVALQLKRIFLDSISQNSENQSSKTVIVDYSKDIKELSQGVIGASSNNRILQQNLVELLCSIDTAESSLAVYHLLLAEPKGECSDCFATYVVGYSPQHNQKIIARLLKENSENANILLKSFISRGIYLEEYLYIVAHVDNNPSLYQGYGILYRILLGDTFLNTELFIAQVESDFSSSRHVGSESLVVASYLNVPHWHSALFAEYREVSIEVFTQVLPQYIASMDEAAFLQLLQKIELYPAQFSRQILPFLEEINCDFVPFLDSYIVEKMARNPLYACRILKVLLDVRKKNSGSEMDTLFAMPQVYEFLKRGFEEVYSLGALYYSIESDGQDYGIGSSARVLFEDSIVEYKQKIADIAFDCITLRNGSSLLLSSRSELRVESRADCGVLVEIIETLPSDLLKDLFVPLLEESDWETDLWMIQNHFYRTTDPLLESILSTNSIWVQECALYWLFDLLKEYPMGKQLEKKLIGIIETNTNHLRHEAQSVLELRNGIMETTAFKHLELAYFLREVSLFSSVPTEKLTQIVEVLEEVSYNKGDIISRETDRANHLYIVKSGIIQTSTNTYKPFDFYGEQGLFSGEERIETVVAKEDCLLYVLSRENLEELIDEVPKIAKNLIISYAQEVQKRDSELYALKKG